MASSVAEGTAYRFPTATDANPIGHLSASQVGEYRDCPRCYFHNRVEHRPRYGTIHFAIGGGLHKVAEVIGKAVLDRREIELDEVQTVAAEEFEGRVSLPVDDESKTELVIDLGKYTQLGEAKDDTTRFARVLHERLPKLFRARGLLAVEWDMSQLPHEMLAAAFPFPVEGRLDHLYGSDDGIVTSMTDLKTSSKRGGPDENGSVQFAMYGLPAYLAGSEWLVGCDTLIKTVTPQFETYWANGDGRITPEQYAAVREIILDVAARISRGDFPIGKGWNGKHNYEHGVPPFSIAVHGFNE